MCLCSLIILLLLRKVLVVILPKREGRGKKSPMLSPPSTPWFYLSFLLFLYSTCSKAFFRDAGQIILYRIACMALVRAGEGILGYYIVIERRGPRLLRLLHA